MAVQCGDEAIGSADPNGADTHDEVADFETAHVARSTRAHIHNDGAAGAGKAVLFLSGPVRVLTTMPSQPRSAAAAGDATAKTNERMTASRIAMVRIAHFRAVGP